MIYVLGYAVAVTLLATFTVVPFVASEKGRSWQVWCLASLFMSPVVALLALAALPSSWEEAVAHQEYEMRSRASGTTS